MPGTLSNLATKQSYVGSTKTPAQRITNRNLGPLALRHQARYGTDVQRSINRKSPKRKGLLSRMAAEGYRA